MVPHRRESPHLRVNLSGSTTEVRPSGPWAGQGPGGHTVGPEAMVASTFALGGLACGWPGCGGGRGGPQRPSQFEQAGEGAGDALEDGAARRS